MTTEHDLGWPFNTEEQSTKSWDEAIAMRRAEEDGIGELSQAHWQFIYTLREHFIQYGAIPPMRYACSSSHLEPHCVDRLFHDAREAWHIAGLPEPGEEAKSYM